MYLDFCTVSGKQYTRHLLTNDEVLELDQDPLGKQARQVEVGGRKMLIKDLEDDSHGVALFNVGPTAAEVSVPWSDFGLTGPQAVRDLWRQQDLGVFETGFGAQVASHTASRSPESAAGHADLSRNVRPSNSCGTVDAPAGIRRNHGLATLLEAAELPDQRGSTKRVQTARSGELITK
jgi:hypothetical protein